jgi:hypothetical protein
MQVQRSWPEENDDSIHSEAQVAVHDPKLIRMDQRLKAWLFSLHGVDLAPITRTIEIGQKPAAYHAGITANRGRRFLRNGSGRRCRWQRARRMASDRGRVRSDAGA